MELHIRIEKSFEGEFRAVVKGSEFADDVVDIITMPWVVGQSTAVKQLGIFLTRASADVVDAHKRNASITPEFIRGILARPY